MGTQDAGRAAYFQWYNTGVKTGLAFGDNISLHKSTGHYKASADDSKKMRGFLLPLLFLFFFLLLFARVIYLQIVKGSFYNSLSNANRIRSSTIHAPRGIIFDRNGIPLVYNVPGYREIINGKTKLLDNNQALSMIAKGGKDLEIDSLREYPYKNILSHVVGYIGQISPDELKSKDFASYSIDDLVGKMGIEKEYEKILRGTDGKQLIEVDATNRKVRTLGVMAPIPGSDIYLTIDINLQKAVFRAMSSVKKGAAIVSTPNGEILALVSKPSFDPNLFTMFQNYQTSDTKYKNVDSVLSDYKNQPLLDRAISGQYPPGSTFKLVVAAAGLESKTIDQNYEVDDTGILRVGSFSFANWYYTDYGKTDGKVNVVKAIKRSNDIFFYTLAGKIGVDKLSAISSKFGIGKSLGIDLPGEAAGILPSKEWKMKNIGESWYLGDTYLYGIGQGYLLTTPLQVNALTQVIANGGTLYRPHLLKDNSLNFFGGNNSYAEEKNLIGDQTESLIREGMVESCRDGGVAWPLFGFSVKNPKLIIDGKNFLEDPKASASAEFSDYRQVSIACKTGTAQHGGEQTLPDAWITLFAPAYNPQIVVTVLSEDSGEGSNVAGPIAKQILDYWFSR